MSNISITHNASADFTPTLGNYTDLHPFRYWCQKVLPLVYDDSLSYYELLCKVVDYLNKTMEDVETLHGDVNNLHKAYAELQGYVNNYFNTLDVQEEINNKLDNMVNDGTLSNLLLKAINTSESPKIVSSVSDMTDHNTIYILTSDGYMYYWNGDNFINSGIKYSESEYSVINNNKLITKWNYSELLPNFDNARSSTYYIFNLPLNSTDIPKNSPFGETWGEDSPCTLLTLLPDYNLGGMQIFQTFNNIYIRAYGESWGSWSKMLKDTNYITQFPTLIGSYNYETLLPDLDNMFDATYYVINIANGSSELPLNTPFGAKWKSDSPCVFITYPVNYKLATLQYFMCYEGVYARTYSTKWSAWTKLVEYGLSKKIVVGSDGDYTSLTRAIQSNNSKNTEILVKDGIYDLFTEFKEYYGDDFFDNYSESSSRGLILDNNVNITFSSKAIIKFNYEGNNRLVNQLFSPLNSGKDGFTIKNANIVASNCRYCVHDERGYSDDCYTNIYESCKFTLDNTNNKNWESKTCLGGGLGLNGYIHINGCIFESAGTSNNDVLLSYHNDYRKGAKSNLLIVNNYLKSGTIRASSHGLSDEKTTMLVGNNKIHSPYILTKETADDNVDNMEILKING